MNSWKPITIGELIDNDEASLQTGPFGTQLKASEYAESGIPVINVKNIGYGDIRNEDLDFVPERTADRLRVHRLRTGDIVFGRKGAADRHALIGPACDGWLQGSDCMRLRLKSKRVMARFLSYYFCTSGHKYWMEAVCAFGATMSTLNQGIARRISFRIPGAEVQNKIAGTLYAYDERIDSNKRRIALLETLAGEIYREWFVRMRFPGHGKVKLVKGIPETWLIEPLGNLLSELIDYRGLTPAKLDSNWEDSGIVALSALNVKNGRLIKLEDAGRVSETLYERWMRKKLQKFDILLTSEAPLGQVYMLMDSERYVLSQRLFGLRANPKRITPCYLYHYLLFPTGQGQLTSRATGSTVGGIRQQLLRKVEVIVPTDGLLKSYMEIVLPILESVHQLSKQNDALNKSRDLLLPRLISGKLSVEKLDIQFSTSMMEELNVEPRAPAHA